MREIRIEVVETLWQRYQQTTPEIKQIQTTLLKKKINYFSKDHLALIDLPSEHTGIPTLRKLFEILGFEKKGAGYLQEKQNDFLWLAEPCAEEMLAQDALPQIVVADFRLNEMNSDVRAIIEKYASLASPLPKEIMTLATLAKNDMTSRTLLMKQISQYLSGRDWPLPTIKEFQTVKKFNELLAWVLVFGRRPNHFTLSIHLLSAFPTLTAFNDFIVNEVGLTLNQEGGVIKGGAHTGIAQSSTMGSNVSVALQDGNVELPMGFVEFVFRYPVSSNGALKPRHWRDYFTGFVADNANHVIESLNSHANTFSETSCTEE